MHRLACFRDDVVFLIFLYQVSRLSGVTMLKSRYSSVNFQRYIYRVDHSRVNEFGQVSVLAPDKDGETKKTK